MTDSEAPVKALTQTPISGALTHIDFEMLSVALRYSPSPEV